MVWNYNSNYFLDTLIGKDRRHYDLKWSETCRIIIQITF
jgi:hypothetical protein